MQTPVQPVVWKVDGQRKWDVSNPGHQAPVNNTMLNALGKAGLLRSQYGRKVS